MSVSAIQPIGPVTLTRDSRGHEARYRIVDDQDRALDFYTRVLGFRKKTEIPMGAHRWLTVVSLENPDCPELVLEPDGHPAVGPFKRALVADGIPFTSFAVPDVQAKYKRLNSGGVQFTQPPVAIGPVTTAVFDDTCGNLIQTAAKNPAWSRLQIALVKWRRAAGMIPAILATPNTTPRERCADLTAEGSRV